MKAPTDAYLVVVVTPEYCDKLRSEGKITFVHTNVEKGVDWEWAGGYPIADEKKTFHLPHFQRSLDIYAKTAEDHGLKLESAQYLSVPNTEQSRSVFAKTVYGKDIVGVASSMLLTFKKCTS